MSENVTAALRKLRGIVMDTIDYDLVLKISSSILDYLSYDKSGTFSIVSSSVGNSIAQSGDYSYIVYGKLLRVETDVLASGLWLYRWYSSQRKREVH